VINFNKDSGTRRVYIGHIATLHHLHLSNKKGILITDGLEEHAFGSPLYKIILPKQTMDNYWEAIF
jgi:hypothetical protein